MRIVFLITALAVTLTVSAQKSKRLSPAEIWQAGLPPIARFTPSNYKAHEQNWDFIQDNNGIIYVGNTSGILEYDGVSWRLIDLPNGSPAKSLAKSEDGTIYVGAVRDFGYLKADSTGRMQYQSLLGQLDTAYHDFADIWFTFAIDDAAYFISDYRIFKWHQNTFKVWQAENGFGFAHSVNGRLYIDKKGIGLMSLRDDSLVLIPDGDKFVDMNGSITVMLPYEDDKILMGHFYNGLFLYDHQTISPLNQETNPLRDKHIYSGIALPSGHFAFGTHGQGCFIVDDQGSVIQWLNKKTGLGSDVIIGFYVDSAGSLWLATENGINRVEISSPLRLFGPVQGLTEGIDRIGYFDKRLFAATKSGLFYLEETSADLEKRQFQFHKIKGIDYQTWDVAARKNFLLAGNFSGLYQVDRALNSRLLLPGNISELCPSPSDSNRIYVGTMTGKLLTLNFTGGRWKINGPGTSVDGRIIRMVEDPGGSLWVSTRYNGVYRLDWSSSNRTRSLDSGYDIKHFTTADGLPEISYNIVSRISDELYFSTQKGVYRFDTEDQRFVPDTVLAQNLGRGVSGFEHLIKASFDGGMWITAGPEFDKQLYEWREDSLIEVSSLKRFSDFSVIDIRELDGLVFLSGISGIVGYNSRLDNSRNMAFPVAIRKVLTNNDSLLFGGNASNRESQEAVVLPFSGNNLRFVFALPAYDNPRGIEYQYYLDGYNQGWSSWSTETQRDFTNLSEGEYTFRVRGRNTYGQVSDEGTFAFTILPPWYRSWWAYLLYAVTGIAVVRLILWWRSDKLQREKAALEQVVKERTRQLEDQAVQLVEMDQMKSRLFANISHEFRTPLTLIKGPVTELLKADGGTLRRSDAQMINRNADRLLRLVNQLLDLSKLDAGNLELETHEGNINLFLRSLSSAFCSHAEQRSINYRIDIPQDEQYACFDHDKLEKIVYNLLSNALKFTPDHGQVTIKAAYDRQQLTLKVADSGLGIAAEKLPNIFDRFFQADNSETRQYEGTGIGLALTKELAQLMGGTISVQSEPGVGSTFTVMIPMQRPGPDIEPHDWESTTTRDVATVTEEVTEPEIDLPNEAPMVLIVEDNADMRRFIKDQLAGKYSILEAKDGKQGLVIACQEIPDLIITDLMMPGMDGLAFCGKVKADERTSHIPVIMLTARAGQEQKIEGLETGADDYLTKPFDKAELLVRMNNMIVQRRRLRERLSRQMILEPDKAVIAPMEETFLRKVMQKVEENLSDPAFGAPQLQDMFAMSKTQLYRKMKALTDRPPGEFIRNYRLKRAAQILAGHGENVTQVAYAVGFNNLSYFAKCFKELYGVSPSEFSKTIR